MTTTTLPRTTARPERCTGGHFLHPGATACSCCGASARTAISLVKAPPPPPPLPHHDMAQACATCVTAAGRAAMTAVGARIPVPVRAWTGHADGTATARVKDGIAPAGTVVRYQPTAPRPFEVAVPCPAGAHHYRTVSTRADWTDAVSEAAGCFDTHADFTDWATAAARDLAAAFAPRAVAPIARVIPLHARGGQI